LKSEDQRQMVEVGMRKSEYGVAKLRLFKSTEIQQLSFVIPQSSFPRALFPFPAPGPHLYRTLRFGLCSERHALSALPFAIPRNPFT